MLWGPQVLLGQVAGGPEEDDAVVLGATFRRQEEKEEEGEQEWEGGPPPEGAPHGLGGGRGTACGGYGCGEYAMQTEGGAWIGQL